MSTSAEKIFDVIKKWVDERLSRPTDSAAACRTRFSATEAAEEMLAIYQAQVGLEKQTPRAFYFGIVALTKLYPPARYKENPFFSLQRGLYTIKRPLDNSYKSLFAERYSEVACLSKEYKRNLKEKRNGRKGQHLQLDTAGIGQDPVHLRQPLGQPARDLRK